MRLICYFLLIAPLFFTNCKDDNSIERNPNARLFFSTDSVLFDTVFTSKASTTRAIKLFNYNNSKILIDELELAGGTSSSFQININGLATNKLSHLEINANDSIYVFIKVNIDPTLEDYPFLVEDSLLIGYNQKIEKLPLLAYGQNAIYINNQSLSGKQSFKKGKPYIFYGYNILTENSELNLEAGARLFFHKKAKLTINGSLNASGTLKDSITFSSDRTERIYKDESGQWAGLIFSEKSQNNKLNYCIIKNAVTGIYIDSSVNGQTTRILLTNSVIKNHQVGGLIANNAEITAINNLFFNCGKYLLAILNGSRYDFYQNTFAGYNYSISRTTPAVSISNNTNTKLTGNFSNNIIWGNNRSEFELKKNNVDINFSHNLIKSDPVDIINGQNNIFNIDPKFVNPRYSLFELSYESPILQYGEMIHTPYQEYIFSDLKGIERAFPSTLGCFQKKSEPF